MKLMRPLIFTALTITALALTACAPVAGKKYATLMQDRQVTRSINYDLLTEMEHGGVQVIQQGSRLILVLPISQFFCYGSLKMERTHIPTMELVSLYLRNYIGLHYTRYPIKIYAHTDEVPIRALRNEYSNEYARVVAAFLWNRGFTAAQLRVLGLGSENPIASNRTTRGSTYNNRVVIQIN